MIVPVSNYVIACILFAALVAYAIYGLYWLSVNVHRNIPVPPPPHGCTGSGYTGTVIIKDAKTQEEDEEDDDIPPNQCIVQVQDFEPVPRRARRRYKGKHSKKPK